jgi:hypothetical protein
MFKIVILSTFIFCFMSCAYKEKNSLPYSNSKRIFYPSGNVRLDSITLTDSTRRTVYYNEYDSGKIDSLSNYRLFQDTLVQWQKFIYAKEKVDQELRVSHEELDSGRYVKFLLLRPNGWWIAVWHISKAKDTTYYGTPVRSTPRQIYVKNDLDSAMTGYVKDWRVWSRFDSSKTWLEHSRYLKFQESK